MHVSPAFCAYGNLAGTSKFTRWDLSYFTTFYIFAMHASHRYEVLHRYMMVFAVSVLGTEEEIEQYADRVAGGFRCGRQARMLGHKSLSPNKPHQMCTS